MTDDPYKPPVNPSKISSSCAVTPIVPLCLSLCGLAYVVFMWRVGRGLPAILLLLLLVVPGHSFALVSRFQVSQLQRGLQICIAAVTVMVLGFLVVLYFDSIWINHDRRTLILSYLENGRVAMPLISCDATSIANSWHLLDEYFLSLAACSAEITSELSLITPDENNS